MNGNTASCTSPLNLALYFLAGGLTGASVALLLAPQSGRATRELMRRKLSDTAESTRGLKDHLILRGQTLGHEAKHRVDGAISAIAGDARVKLPG